MQDDITDRPDPGANTRARRQRLDRKLSLVAGGAALVWLGLALGLGLGMGAGLLGAGLVLGTEQGARRHWGLALDAGWIVAAAVAVLGGVLMLAGVSVPIGALILVGLGLAIAVSALWRRRG